VFGEGGSEDDGGRSPTDGDESSDEEGVKDVSEFGPADFRREAEEFAADREEEEFDFTVESLERLDEYAASQTEALDALDGEMTDTDPRRDRVPAAVVTWCPDGTPTRRRVDG